MKRIIAMILALVFAMNFAVVSFASSAVAVADDETVITAVDEINDEADDGIVEDETVEDENAGEQPSLLENDFIRFILDLIDILKSTFRFLEKVFNN